MQKVLVPLAEGFEEIEAVTIIDVLRRAEMHVVIAALAGDLVIGAHGIAIQADRLLDGIDEDEFAAIVLPGGMPGSRHLIEHDGLLRILRQMNEKKKWIGAICAAPTVIKAAGIIEGRQMTSYPAYENDLEEAVYCQDSVVVDENLVTSRGPGTALIFSLQMVSLLAGEEKAAELTKAMLVV